MVFAKALRVCQLSDLQLSLLDLKLCSLFCSRFLILLFKVVQSRFAVRNREIDISEDLYTAILNEVDI